MSFDENFTPDTHNDNENVQNENTHEIEPNASESATEQLTQEIEPKADELGTNSENSTEDTYGEQIPYSGESAQQQLNEEFKQLENPKKKKFILNGAIITACGIFVIALLAFLCYRFLFMQSLTQTVWRYDYNEEIALYYTFESDNKIVMSYGSTSYFDTYSLSNETNSESGKSQQVLSISPNNGIIAYNSPVSGSYYYSISGNKLFGGLKLTLTSSDGTKIELNGVKAPKNVIKPDKTKVNDKLTGTWNYTDETSGQSATFTFSDDGILTYDINYTYNGVDCGSSRLECAYSAGSKSSATNDEASSKDNNNADSVITVTIIDASSKEIEQEIAYSFENDKLIINGMAYSKVEK